MSAIQTVTISTVHRRPWYRRVGDALRAYTAGPWESKDPTLAEVMGYGPTSSGVRVDEVTALNLSTVWAAVNVISSDVAALPLQLFKLRPNDQGREKYVDHPLYDLLHAAPNPEMSSFTFRQALEGHVLTWGNGYAEIERNGSGKAVALWPLTPNRVYPYRDDFGRLRYRVVRADNASFVTLDASNVLHVHGLSFDGVMGYSVIAKARESLGLTKATETFGAQFFGNSSQISGIFKHPGRLSDSAFAHLRQSLREEHGGNTARSPIILEEGMDWTQIGVPPDDGQFLGTRLFQVSEVARWFNLPPHKLRDLSRATFSNIEQQNIEYVVGTLTPHLVNWEQELDRKLISTLERRRQFTKHNVNALLRGDLPSRYAAYAVARQWGWYSANDVLRREDENPIGEQGDVYLMPGNMLDADGPMPNPNTPPPAPASLPGNDGGDEPDSQGDDDDEAERAWRESQAAGLRAIVAEVIRLREVLPTSPADGLETRLEGVAGELAALTELVRERLPAVPQVEQPEPPAAPPEDAPVVEPARARERARLIAGHRAAIEDAVSRIVRRESLRAQRVKSPEKLRAWIADYYPKQAPMFETMLAPAIQAHAGVLASDPADLTRALVAEHVDASRAQLHALLDASPENFTEAVAALLDRWQRERPAALADRLMEEELAHAA